MQFEVVLDILCITFSLAGVAANLLLIYVTIRCENRDLRIYSLLIRLIAIVAACMSASTALSAADTVNIDSTYFFVNRSLVGRLSPWVEDVFTTAKIALFYMYSFMSPLAFTFRYSIIVRRKPLKRRPLLAVFCVFAIISVIMALTVFELKTFSVIDRPEFRQVLVESNIITVPQYFRILQPNGDGIFLVAGALLTGNFVASLFCCIQIVRFLKKHKRSRPSGYRVNLQSRLNYAFILQMLYPMLFAMPILIVGQLKKRGDKICSECLLIQNQMQVLVPAADAITVLCLIRHYRRVVLRLFCDQDTNSVSVNTTETSKRLRVITN